MRAAEKIIFGIAFIVWIGLMAYGVVSIVTTVANAAEDITPTPLRAQKPDIRHCFDEEETRDLWDCIRHVD